MVIIRNYKVKKLFNKFPEISGKIGINFRKFPEVFRGKFPEISELTTLVTNTLAACRMFRLRMLFKASRADIHENCVVTTRRKRQTDEQLEPLDNRLMTEAVDSGRQQIQQVSLTSPFSSILLKCISSYLRHISHISSSSASSVTFSLAQSRRKDPPYPRSWAHVCSWASC